MGLQNLFSKIMGFLIIIITLALAPAIDTANTVITGHANVTQMIGMSVVSAFGAPLIIIGLLVAGGAFAIAGVRGKNAASMGDMMGVIGSVIVVIVALTFMDSIMTYVTALMLGKSGFAFTIYSIIPLIIYLGVIAAAGWKTVSTYRGKKKNKSAATGY